MGEALYKFAPEGGARERGRQSGEGRSNVIVPIFQGRSDVVSAFQQRRLEYVDKASRIVTSVPIRWHKIFVTTASPTMLQEEDVLDWTSEAFNVIDFASDIEDAVVKIRDILNVDHVVYHSSKLGTSPSRDPYIRLTYPASWIKRYLSMNYVDVDPVLKEGFLRVVPFKWSELTIGSQAQMNMLIDALQHGVGPNGFSIPVRSKQGHRGLFSLSHSGSPDEWDAFCSARVKGLSDIAHRLHRRVIKERFGEELVHLSSRETECLFWSAQGKDTKTISQILEISHHTVRDYLKSARYKLDSSTVAQAINKAVELGIVSLQSH